MAQIFTRLSLLGSPAHLRFYCPAEPEWGQRVTWVSVGRTVNHNVCVCGGGGGSLEYGQEMSSGDGKKKKEKTCVS